MNKPMMRCGHVANATSNGKPVCVICYGIAAGADEVAEQQLNLEGRKAKCSCGRTVDSSTSLPFFEFKGEGSRFATGICKCGYHECAHHYSESRVCKDPVECPHGGFTPRGPAEFDSFYCGCRGWD